MLDRESRAAPLPRDPSRRGCARSRSPTMKVLVVCRGPVRKEAFDVFDEVGVREYGMLLSEKDSVVYPRCLAPELRSLRFPHNVHRVPDYMGAGQEEKQQRIREIVEIARSHGYTHIFAGYGFMAEDAEFIEAIEQAGLALRGPVVARGAPRRRQGRGQEARARARQRGDPRRRRRLARARCCARAKDRAGARGARARSTASPSAGTRRSTLEENAEALLQAGYAKHGRAGDDRRAAGGGRARSATRSGASTRSTASASSTSAAAAARASAWSAKPTRGRRRGDGRAGRVEGAGAPARTGTSWSSSTSRPRATTRSS